MVPGVLQGGQGVLQGGQGVLQGGQGLLQGALHGGQGVLQGVLQAGQGGLQGGLQPSQAHVPTGRLVDSEQGRMQVMCNFFPLLFSVVFLQGHISHSPAGSSSSTLRGQIPTTILDLQTQDLR